VDRTLVIVKPDGVERGLAGQILARFEARQLSLVAVELRRIDRPTAERHYAEHVGQPYFDGLVTFITRGPALLVVVEGADDTWQIVRTMMGATNSKGAAPGTIRGDLGTDLRENLIHGSDSADSAKREIAIFFPEQA
jgi:nucleoside-diphosphate kinase